MTPFFKQGSKWHFQHSLNAIQLEKGNDILVIMKRPESSNCGFFISIPQNKEFAAEGVKESKYIMEHIALLCFSCETHLILDL